MKSSVTRHKQKDVARFHHHKVDSENREGNRKRDKRGKSKTKANKGKRLNHPYKGNMVDIRG